MYGGVRGAKLITLISLYSIHFAGITGEESFLGNIPPEVWEENNGEFELRFYFDRSLDLGFFDALNEAGDKRARAENPGDFDDIITLADVDWDALMADYESLIYGVRLSRPGTEWNEYRQKYELEFGSFSVEHDQFYMILNFINENQRMFFNIDTEAEHTYGGSIHFRKTDESEPWVIADFYMDASLNSQLMEILGEEAWEAEQERQRQEHDDFMIHFNDDERILSEDIDCDDLRANYDAYINRILIDHLMFMTDEEWWPDIELASGADWSQAQLEHILKWLSENPDLYSEEMPESGFVIFIRFRRVAHGLENETYADKSAWFFISDDYWDEVMGY